MKLNILILFLLLISPVIALSDESLKAGEGIYQAKQDLLEIQGRDIPSIRANETYEEAFQLYSAQLSFEKSGRNAKYDLVLKYVAEISEIKIIAFKAQDELKVFEETYRSAEKETDLSEMQNVYDELINSFQEERFEDTLELLEGGYNKLSEVQSNQEALKLFYSSTSESIKKFLQDNWVMIEIILGILIILTLIFAATFSKILLRIKLNNLVLRKKTIKELIKQLQYNYFRKGSISELEFGIKLKKFTNLIRDLDRKIMVIKTDMFKLRVGKEQSPKIKISKKVVKKEIKIVKKEVKEVKKSVKLKVKSRIKPKKIIKKVSGKKVSKK